MFELLRWHTDGPLVDRIVLTSPYGFIAFVLGRGVHGLLALAPMLLGAAVGAGLARRAASTSQRLGPVRLAGRSGAVMLGLAVVLLAAAVARPASTPPILADDGSALAGSVTELTRVEVGNHELGLMLRGNSVDNPVLLFLAGGPGGSEFGAMRRHGQALEQDFVVATLDQVWQRHVLRPARTDRVADPRARS